jgi:3',5'-cyclic-AMP phosphodiesterase
MNARLVWATDVHLNFIDLPKRRWFYYQLIKDNPTHILITGDIAQANNLLPILIEMRKFIEVPVYFTLGNHDFYYGSIDGIRQELKDYNDTDQRLNYLPDLDPIELTKEACLVGVDGFYDGKLGDYFYSNVVMSDFSLIHDFKYLQKDTLFAKLNKLGIEEAFKAEILLRKAFRDYQVVYFGTHVPPFKEATWHMGKHSDDNWLPFFSCEAMGSTLLRLCEEFNDRELIVYCGHTHGSGTYQPLPNLTVHTGAARYGRPTVSDVIDL